MSGTEQAANDLFFKLRNRFPHINMTDDDSQATENPQAARFFNFDYEEDGVKFGNLTASLADSQTLSLIYHLDITKYMDRAEKKKWYDFLRELRKFAKSHMLRFDVHDITKAELSQKDLKFVTNQNKEKNQLGESRVLWARRGKVSEGDVGNVKVHVFHSERMDENPHNRLLRVDRIFLVNESGERFLLPFKSVVGAKAMANHVSRGGNPYDTTGKLIGNAVNEMTNLRRFASATRRKTFESEDAHQIIEAAQSIKESIKRSLFRLANNSRFDENIEDLNKLLAEQDDVEDIKPYFMQSTYNENLDNWLGSAAKAFKQYKGNIMENLRESAGTVAQKLSDPQWKLVLKDEPAEDRIIASSKYTDGRALLRRILGTIADRASMEDSDIANWASQIGQDMEMGAASQEDMQIALHLAKRYQNDLAMIAKSPEYGKEIRVAAFGQKKDLYGKAKDESMEFENYVQGIGEGPEIQQDKLPPMSAMDRIHQKLGTGPFTPQTAQPTNTAPLPGSPGPGPDDRAALTRMIDNESEEEPNEPSPDPGYPPPSPNTPDDVEEQVSGSAMDRISARVAARDGETTPMERVSERVASRSSADTVNEKAVTNESLDTILWLSGVKKKSNVSEADADWASFINNEPRTPTDPNSAPKVELPKAGPDVAPKVELPKGPAATAPEVELTKPKFNYSPIDNKFTQLPDKGFSPAPNIEPPSKAPPTSSGPFNLGPPDPVGPNPKTPFNLGPPDPVGPNPKAPFEPKISPDQVREPNKFSIGDTLKNIAIKALPRVAGGALGAIVDPTPAGQGDTGPLDKAAGATFNPTPISKQNVMMPGKTADAMPVGTLTDPNLVRMRDLAGIGRK